MSVARAMPLGFSADQLRVPFRYTSGPVSAWSGVLVRAGDHMDGFYPAGGYHRHHRAGDRRPTLGQSAVARNRSGGTNAESKGRSRRNRHFDLTTIIRIFLRPFALPIACGANISEPVARHDTS